MSKSRTPAPEADEAPQEPTGALTQQMTDEEIMAAIQAEQAKNAARSSAPRQVSLQDLYFQITALVKTEARLPRAGKLSEASAVKLLELSLMWALNTRNQPAPILTEEPDFPVQEIGESSEADDGPTPNEEIGFDESNDESADEENAA